jgi:hypothetical protein
MSTTVVFDSHVLKVVPCDVPDPVRLGFLWRTVVAQVAVSTDRLLGADPDHGLVKVGQAGRDQVSASRDFEVLDIQCLADEPT